MQQEVLLESVWYESKFLDWHHKVTLVGCYGPEKAQEVKDEMAMAMENRKEETSNESE